MEISKLQLEQLASHIHNNLQCACGLSYEKSNKEPCACGWTHVAEWFEDECNMEFKFYPESFKKFYKEYYNMDIIIKEKNET